MLYLETLEIAVATVCQLLNVMLMYSFCLLQFLFLLLYYRSFTEFCLYLTANIATATQHGVGFCEFSLLYKVAHLSVELIHLVVVQF